MAMVCLCEGINDRKVRRAISTGAASVREVAEICGAGANCYGCHDTIADMIDESVAAVDVARRMAF